MVILIHSSKTMRSARKSDDKHAFPVLFTEEVERLSRYLKTLTKNDIQKVMTLSKIKSDDVYALIENYRPENTVSPALDLFLGDIYSGLQAQTFTPSDRQYANSHLFILSGLYGVLRALDEIQPYRLEMGYKLPGNAHVKDNPLDKHGNPTILNITSLYAFWGDKIAKQLPKNQDIINLSAVEYTKTVLPYITGTKNIKPIEGHEKTRIITPKFLTVSPKTGQPTFVTVHAKIARGAFTRWLIQNRIEDLAKLKDFKEIGYKYDKALSTPEQPVFVAQEFKGLGLSIRLT